MSNEINAPVERSLSVLDAEAFAKHGHVAGAPDTQAQREADARVLAKNAAKFERERDEAQAEVERLRFALVDAHGMIATDLVHMVREGRRRAAPNVEVVPAPIMVPLDADGREWESYDVVERIDEYDIFGECLCPDCSALRDRAQAQEGGR